MIFSLILVAAAPAVNAQPLFDGPYGGVRLGYEHESTNHHFVAAPGDSGSNAVGFDGDGATGGGFVGYGRQLGQFYLGVELGLDAASTSGSRHYGADERLTGDIGSGWDIGIRAGYRWNDNLIAATGGFGQRRAKFTYSLGGVQFGSVKSWADAPFVGIGFERPFASHMFWRADYRHAWIATQRIGTPGSGLDIFKTETDQVLLGLSYRF